MLRASSLVSFLLLALAAAACAPELAPYEGTGGADGEGGASSAASSVTVTGGVASSTTSTGGGSSVSSSTSTASVSGSSSSGDGGAGGGAGGGEPHCTEGTIVCDGTTKRVCDDVGNLVDEEDCAPGVCVDGIGCGVCEPGSGSCSGDTSTVCNADGTGFDVYECDAEQGVVCNAGTGHCEGACAPETIGQSYVGCDYYPTITLNAQLVDDPLFQAAMGSYAVAVANTSDASTNVKVHRGAQLVMNVAVAANSVQIIRLPWIQALKDATTSSLVQEGAYRLRTTRPVTVYQYNPIEYTTPTGRTFTSDASVLLPTNAWTGTYRVASRNSFRTFPGFYAVTAREDGTTVTLAPSATGNLVKAGGGVAANGTGVVVMNQGDVLQVLGGTNGADVQNTDLTGTLVSADKPVQVIGGHDCTNIPVQVLACDHLEESMLPVETLSTRYLIASPQHPVNDVADTQLTRIIATEPSTTLTFDPPVPGALNALANAGDWFEIPATATSYEVTSNKPILVAQYMLGHGEQVALSDPSMTVAVAVEQFRSEYLFHAPTNYVSSWANVIAPLGATITLDGEIVSGFSSVGTSGFAVARVELSNAGDGNHEITGTSPFGVSVYGYGEYTSYWYPAGLDLENLDD